MILINKLVRPLAFLNWTKILFSEWILNDMATLIANLHGFLSKDFISMCNWQSSLISSLGFYHTWIWTSVAFNQLFDAQLGWCSTQAWLIVTCTVLSSLLLIIKHTSGIIPLWHRYHIICKESISPTPACIFSVITEAAWLLESYWQQYHFSPGKWILGSGKYNGKVACPKGKWTA